MWTHHASRPCTQAYITAYDSSNPTTGGKIKVCTVAPDGTLVDCLDTVTGLGNIEGIAVLNGFAYYVAAAGAVYVCRIEASTGGLTGCEDSGATGISVAQRIVMDGGRAYITTSGALNDGLVKCNVRASDGHLIDCAATGGLDAGVGTGALNNTIAVAFSSAEPKFAYVRRSAALHIWKPHHRPHTTTEVTCTRIHATGGFVFRR